MITSGALVCVHTVLRATTSQISTEIIRSTKQRIGDSFYSKFEKSGKVHKRHKRGTQKAQKKFVPLVSPFCAFCGSFPFCRAKPLHISTETLIQTGPAAAGCWWPTVGLLRGSAGHVALAQLTYRKPPSG